MTTIERPSPNPFLAGNLAPVHEEVTVTDLRVTGTIPTELTGRYLRNGPNPAGDINEVKYHWFTGHGMVHGIRLDGGQAKWYRNRWVRTKEVCDILGGTPPPSDWPAKHPSFPANTNIVGHAGRTYAIVEAGSPPVELSYDLDTVRVSNLDGTLPFAFSAHPKRNPATGEMHVMTYYWGWGNQVQYLVVGVDGRVRRHVDIPLPGGPMIHDMAITEHFTILHDLPLRPDPEALKAGRYKIKFNGSQPSRFGIVPHYGQAHEVRWFNAKPAYLLHVVNAWEEGDEIVMVGTPYKLHLDDNGQPDGRRLEKTIHNRQRDFMLYEWRFDLKTGQTRERCIDDVLNTEFPVINSQYQGRKNRYSYNIIFAHGGKEEVRFPGLVKYDISAGSYVAYSAGPQFFYNEPGFAPRDNSQSEDDGYLVVLVWNPHEEQSEIQIFDCKGAKMAEGPIARVILPRRIPHGFHATFVSQTTLNRWK